MSQRQPTIDISIFKKRRSQIASQMEGATLILCSNPEYIRNYDTLYEYRQDTNFYYMTGFEEPESVFVFRPGQSPESVLFVRNKDPLRETWDGFRYGVEFSKKTFLMDETFLIDDLGKKLPELLQGSSKVLYQLNQYPNWDKKILSCLDQAKQLAGKSRNGLLPIEDSSEFLAQFRIFKEPIEIEWLKKACQISAEAHVEVMKYIRPGMNEREVQGFLEYQFKKQMSPRVAYPPIVASGNNACTLHYVFNDQECRDGDLLLIDAGAEFQYMNGDITRTFPINGKFTEAQKTIYNHVLTVQKSILEILKPGVLISDVQAKATELLTESLKDLGFIKGDTSELIKNQSYKKYYPHGVSHWLGMDTHDAGLYQVQGKGRPLEPNMCFTVEPGLYISKLDDSVPESFRGIGVRIEDDVCMTESGYFNMTDGVPKEISEIESLMKS